MAVDSGNLTEQLSAVSTVRWKGSCPQIVEAIQVSFCLQLH